MTYSHDFRERLKIGLDYERFVVGRMKLRASESKTVTIRNGTSWNHDAVVLFGDSAVKIEVKLDRMFRQTGNFFFECVERRTTKDKFYDGPLMLDEDMIWLQGDYQGAYLWDARVLRLLLSGSCGTRGIRKVSTPTSAGFLCPVRVARSVAHGFREICFDEKQLSLFGF